MTAIVVGLSACGAEDRVVVPEVEGLTAQAAIDRVCGRFLTPELARSNAPVAEAPGPVTGSDPAAGEEVAVSATITLFLRLGPGETLLPEPGCDVP